MPLLLFAAIATSSIAHFSLLAADVPVQTDHFNSTSAENFTLRVQRRDHPASKNKVLLFFLPGLTPLPGITVGDLNTLEGPLPDSVQALALNTSAVVFVIEHRFTGGSAPRWFNRSAGFDSQLRRFLGLDQVLGDVAEVISFVDRTLEQTPDYVMVVGEGYGGTLASLFRERYPQYADAALAVSAPVDFAPFAADADAQIIRALEGIRGGCAQTAQALLRKAHTAFESADGAAQDEIRRLFGFAENWPGLPILHALADIFVQMVRTGTAADFCSNVQGADFAEFAREFNRTLRRIGQSAEEFDVILQNNSVQLFVQCASIGNFDVYDQNHSFRSPYLNGSFYSQVCGQFGVDLNEAAGRLNDYFGGQNQGSSAVLFAYSSRDIHSTAMTINEDLSRDRRVVVRDDPTGYNLNQIDNRILDVFVEWSRDPCFGNYTGMLSDLRHGLRAHGEVVLRHCKCKVGWSGKHCEKEHITMDRFKGLATMATAIPTIVVFMTSIVVWKTILVDPETAKSKPIVL
jgi:pimeloyl-ACP methyl ester carboxylesterase